MEQLLIIFFGLTGSGKSYLASRWAKSHGYSYYNTDAIRKTIAGITPTKGAAAPVGEGIYSKAFSRRTYDALFEAATKDLQNKTVPCVVLDGSYQDQAERKKLITAFTGSCRVLFIYCFCSESVTRKRLVQRRSDPDAVSDGRLEIYLHQKKSFHYPEELPSEQLLRLDTDKGVEYLMGELNKFCLKPK